MASIPNMLKLLRQTLDGVAAEFCVLATNLLGGFVLSRIAKSLCGFEAVPAGCTYHTEKLPRQLAFVLDQSGAWPAELDATLV